MSSWLQYRSDECAVPRKAAAIIAYSPEKDSVLLVKRNPALAFMGGHYAFPGGSISEYDTGTFVRNAPNASMAAQISAAVREMFEETGVLLAHGTFPNATVLENARRHIAEYPSRFEYFLDEWGMHIHAGDFREAGHWITPTFSPMRFDTQYFLHFCDATGSISPLGDDAEIVATEWMRPGHSLESRITGEMLLSTPVVFALRCLTAFSPEEASENLQHTPGFSDRVLDYIEPIAGIHIVPLPSPTLPPADHTNCIIIGDNEMAIIDPGTSDPADQERFLAHMDHLLHLCNGRVQAVLLTHDHPDHMAAARILSQKYGAPIYGHSHVVETGHADTALEDGSIVSLSGMSQFAVRVIHTPGHHPGHLSFWEENTQTLFCGDLAANPGTILVDPNAGGDMTEYLASLQRLGELEPRLTVPAHGAPLFGKDGTDLFHKTAAHRLWRESKIAEAIDAGASTIDDILDRAYADTPAFLREFAVRQLKAHLKRLKFVPPHTPDE